MYSKPRSTHKSTRLYFCVALALLAATWAQPASAGFIHTYTGESFEFAQTPYTTFDSVSGSFTTDNDLGPNRALASVTGLPGFTFSFTDGLQTFDNINCCTHVNFVFDIGTDGSGSISEWDIYLQNEDQYLISTESGLGIEQGIFEGDTGFNFGNPGTWITSTTTLPEPAYVPEPMSLAIFGLGLAGLGYMRRGRAA